MYLAVRSSTYLMIHTLVLIVWITKTAPLLLCRLLLTEIKQNQLQPLTLYLSCFSLCFFPFLHFCSLFAEIETSMRAVLTHSEQFGKKTWNNVREAITTWIRAPPDTPSNSNDQPLLIDFLINTINTQNSDDIVTLSSWATNCARLQFIFRRVLLTTSFPDTK